MTEGHGVESGEMRGGDSGLVINKTDSEETTGANCRGAPYLGQCKGPGRLLNGDTRVAVRPVFEDLHRVCSGRREHEHNRREQRGAPGGGGLLEGTAHFPSQIEPLTENTNQATLSKIQA